MQDTYYQEKDQIFLTTKETYYDIILVPKKVHFYLFLKIKNVSKESPNSIKIKYIL